MRQLAFVKPYGQITVTDLVGDASVSRQTFYELFDDRDACFAAAYNDAGKTLFANVNHILRESEWSKTVELAVHELLDEVAREPEAAWLYFVEGLAGGAGLKAIRDHANKTFERLTHEFLDRAPADGETFDIPPVALLGATRTLIGNHLRTHAVDQLPLIAEDLLAWIGSYAIPARKRRWSASAKATLQSPVFVRMPDTLLPRPKRLPRKHELPPSLVTRNRRIRIIHATAEMAMKLGYDQMRLSDIVAEAAIAKHVFYEHFESINEAFLAAQEYALQETMTACAQAYFTGKDWVQRTWKCLMMLTTLMSKEPALAHARFVELYAAGPKAIERQQQMIASYTVFMQEGYLQTKAATSTPQSFTTMISGALFELLRQEAANGNIDELSIHLPELTYIATAPFVGPEKAAERIDAIASNYRRSRRSAATRPRRRAGAER